jgi:shikimate dehydrogenase
MEITSRTRLVILIGHPVGHSISPQIYNRVFEEIPIDARFLALDIRPDRFARIVPALLDSGFSGNVTAPFKEKVFSLIDIPSDEAILTGVCNVFWSKDGLSYGDNTDILGFREGLPPSFRKGIRGSRAIVLGAGGAARSVAVGLLHEGIDDLVIVNRNEARAAKLSGFLSNLFPECTVRGSGYDSLDLIPELDYPFMVNATSCGWKDREKPPIDPAGIPGLNYYSDVIYRSETELMRQCRSLGVEVACGMEMLVRQGALSLERWFGIEAPLDLMRECALKAMEGASDEDIP